MTSICTSSTTSRTTSPRSSRSVLHFFCLHLFFCLLIYSFLGRAAHGGRSHQDASRASKGSNARVPAASPSHSSRLPVHRPAGLDRRHHGDVLVYSCRDREGDATNVRVDLPRRGPRDVPGQVTKGALVRFLFLSGFNFFCLSCAPRRCAALTPPAFSLSTSSSVVRSSVTRRAHSPP